MNPSETPSFPKHHLSSEAARSWCMGLHLSGLSGLLLPIILAHILVPLTIWLLKRSESYEIDRTGKEVLNFQLSYTLYLLVAGGLCWILIGFLIFPFFFIAWLLLPILAAIKTNNGIHYRYPLTLHFLK
ncbi:MAG: DUF4870 domain-containing protein [Chthoniobacterales bacterium]